MERKAKHEVIDVDDLELVCTGVRHIVRIDRPPSPRARKSKRPLEVINLVDSDDSDDDSSNTPVASSSRSGLPSPSSNMVAKGPLKRQTELQRITQRELQLRRAADLVALPPPKKQANAVVIAKLNEVAKSDLKRKERLSEETIDVLSDDDNNTPVKRAKLDSLGRKNASLSRFDVDVKPRTGYPEDRDVPHEDTDNDEDECVNFLASLDISDETNWIPLPASNKAEDLTAKYVPTRAPAKPSSLDSIVPTFRSTVRYDSLLHKHSSENQWEKISRVFGTTLYPKPFHHARRRDRLPLSGCTRSPKLYHDLAYDKLGITAKYPHLASGSINKIIQAPGKIVLGAVTFAGNAEEDEERPLPPENTSGNLVVFNHGHVHKVRAHCRTRMTNRGPVLKYYSVNDVAFDPSNSSLFLSTGYDLAAQVWEIPEYEKSSKKVPAPRLIRTLTFGDVPQDAIFKSDGSLLAISCTNATVSLFCTHEVFEDSSDVPFEQYQFQVAPNKMGQATGAITWGLESTNNMLITSSEPKPDDNDTITGYHRIWDTETLRRICELDTNDVGDAMAITPDGSTLALITAGPQNSHPMRLYDIRRSERKAYEMEELEGGRTQSWSSVDPERSRAELLTCARFSADGRLLAIARNDNRLHIYDIRALSKGPLCRFEHYDLDVGGQREFGIIEAVWVEGKDQRRIGILSGGNDGCVRLWEPSLAPCDKLQGTVVGSTDFDVAHFSIGDGWRGEIPMVIGDSGGGLHTYDLMDEEGCAIQRSWPPGR